MPVDGQIWENEQYVVQLEQFNTSWKMVMFSKRSNSLHFVEAAVYENEERMVNLLKKMNLQPSDKNIVVRIP